MAETQLIILHLLVFNIKMQWKDIDIFAQILVAPLT